jgi:type II secretory pathway component GspD/PulD (secretin)
VPLLADIPLLGGLFGGTQTRSTEIELFLFITPTIIADDGDIARATMERVPERFLEEEFIRTGPIRPPEISPQVPDTAQCDPDDPECVR